MNLSGRSAEIIVSKYMRKTYRPSTLKMLLTCPAGTIIWVLMGGAWSFQIYYTRKMVYGYHQLHQIWKKKWIHWQENMVIIFLTGPEWTILSPPSLPPPPQKNRKNPSAPPLSPTYKKNKIIVKSYQFDLKKKFRKLSSFYILLEREFRNIPRWG